ncbi:MAG: hypothetical protein KF739_02140 [Cryobacterium sp.]|nr:hypothetical protein [Micrococcales bacterium]MBX3078266.1 hypothetical protein [Cryobacterium sp.]MBX3309217.1 hypothetical protein [Cryobacterium sp.]HNP15521.1 hypothetical protein [Terrimesophilobacter sp.]
MRKLKKPVTGILTLGLAATLAGCSLAPHVPVATFKVAGGETFKVELATPELEAHARALLAGENIAAIPNGIVVRDSPGVNAPWSWHIDPATLEFAFATTEVCDGIPSYVEDEIVTSDYFCPWSAKVIDVK